ncbi:MAG: hypothetical protein HUJ96_07565 [Marinilabiliaceae bacterium]|nr:hypothetical protein [Marinilabiliaceae bacterium]
MALDAAKLFAVILGITLFIISKPTKVKADVGCFIKQLMYMLLGAFWFSIVVSAFVFLPLWLLYFVISPDEMIERYALHDSHKCIGVVYEKYKSTEYVRRVRRINHLQIGVSQSQTKDHIVKKRNKDIFDNIQVGDTVILRVSDEYPRVNKVLNWNPTHAEIEKYKVPVKLIEK